MSRIASVFSHAGHKALIPYVTVGYPSVDDTLEVVPLMAGNGCDIVELGIPFSDPLADGATIQKASFHALQNGVTPQMCLEVAAKLRQKVDVPLVFMTYFNPVLHYGLEKFCSDCAGSGVDGLIIPDLPPDEGLELENITRKHNMDLIYLLAPTSSDKRISLIAERARGFIYLVSVTGVTGSRDSLPLELNSFVSRVRKAATQPLCVGFGISTPEQARQVTQIADGIIVGSKIIQIMETEGLTTVGNFISQLRRAVDKANK
jgi:tryptophan synthase alpha chain